MRLMAAILLPPRNCRSRDLTVRLAALLWIVGGALYFFWCC